MKKDKEKVLATAKKIKVGLVCDITGHFIEMKLLKDAYDEFDYFYITYDHIVTHDMKNTYYFKEPKAKSLLSISLLVRYLTIFFQSFAILLKEKPEVLISTGGGLPVPVFYAGKILGIKLIFIEHIGRFTSPSNCGRALYPICARFFVQNPGMLAVYGKKAEYHGGIV